MAWTSLTSASVIVVVIALPVKAALSIELLAELIDDFPQVAGVFLGDLPGQIGARS
jgi:hypothetical protein